MLRTVQGIIDIDDDANDGDEARHRDIRLWVTGTEEVVVARQQMCRCPLR